MDDIYISLRKVIKALILDKYPIIKDYKIIGYGGYGGFTNIKYFGPYKFATATGLLPLINTGTIGNLNPIAQPNVLSNVCIFSVCNFKYLL